MSRITERCHGETEKQRSGVSEEERMIFDMPYDDEEPAIGWKPDAELNELSGKVIGAAIEVHKGLGAGLDESSYENALALEFSLRGIEFQRQVWIDVEYKGEIVRRRRIDFIIVGRLIAEVKAVQELIPLFSAQVYTYLKLTNLPLGLLINFDVQYLKDGLKRVIRPT